MIESSEFWMSLYEWPWRIYVNTTLAVGFCVIWTKFPRVVLTIVLEYLAVVFVDLNKNSRKLEMEVKVLKDQRQKAGIRYINVDVTKRRQSKA